MSGTDNVLEVRGQDVLELTEKSSYRAGNLTESSGMNSGWSHRHHYLAYIRAGISIWTHRVSI